jgi:hypothetical protein
MLEIRAPQFPCWIDPILSDETRNRHFAERLLKRRTEILEVANDHQIFRTGKEHRGYIVFVSSPPLSIGYLVRFAGAKYALLDVPATRVKLWRQLAMPGVPGLTHRILFDHLLGQHRAIISDGPQTTRGREFWISRLAEATNFDLRVALLNASTSEVNWYDSGPAHFKSWWAQVENRGIEDTYRYMRHVIAKRS